MSKAITRTMPLYCLYRENDPGSIQIDSNTLASIVEQLSKNSQTEQGGFLGIDSRGILSSFWYDEDGQRDATGYKPGSICLAAALRKWRSEGISFAGIIHTHSYLDKLSRSDLLYTQRLLESNPCMEKLIMGLLVGGKLRMYLFDRAFIPWLNYKLQSNEPLYRSQM